MYSRGKNCEVLVRGEEGKGCQEKQRLDENRQGMGSGKSVPSRFSHGFLKEREGRNKGLSGLLVVTAIGSCGSKKNINIDKTKRKT